MTQTKRQREWYLKNRERILDKLSSQTKLEMEKKKRTLVCPICKEEFFTYNKRTKYCEKIECKKAANSNRGNKFRKLNKEYLKNYYKDYKMTNKEHRKLSERTRHLRIKYGITLEDYNRMFTEQEGRCLICGVKKEKLHVDHNHLTGKVRSLLCFHCNAGLGHFHENTDLINKAIEYLKSNS